MTLRAADEAPRAALLRVFTLPTSDGQKWIGESWS